jgi:hypothetical protein
VGWGGWGAREGGRRSDLPVLRWCVKEKGIFVRAREAPVKVVFSLFDGLVWCWNERVFHTKAAGWPILPAAYSPNRKQ